MRRDLNCQAYSSQTTVFPQKIITVKNRWSNLLVEFASLVGILSVDIASYLACKYLLKGLERVNDLAKGCVARLATYFMTQFSV